MSTIISHVILAVSRREEAPQRVIDQWAEAFKLNALRIAEKRRKAIPNEERYKSRLAKPSNVKFSPFVNPAFVSETGRTASGILSSHQANLDMSFLKYQAALDFVFATVDGEVAKRFKEMIDAKRQAFSHGLAQRTLPFTGVKAEELGPAPIAARWLVRDQMVVERLRAADRIMEGGPFLVTTMDNRSDLKAALVQKLVQVGATIIKANLSPAIIAEQNDRINHVMQSNIDPALGLVPFSTGAESHVDYILTNNDIWLEVKVSQA